MKENTVFRQLALGCGVVSASNLYFPILYLYTSIILKLSSWFGFDAPIGYHEVNLDILQTLEKYFSIDNNQFIYSVVFSMLSLMLYILHKKINKLKKGGL